MIWGLIAAAACSIPEWLPPTLIVTAKILSEVNTNDNSRTVITVCEECGKLETKKTVVGEVKRLYGLK